MCVIGAGPSGTAVLRSFQSAREKGAVIPKIVCYEKQQDLGGLWNYTYRTGIDETAEPVHCSMYRYLWSNGPKEALEFADYSFEKHFGKPIPSYPPRAVLADYIKGRIEEAGVRSWIKFRTPVRWVERDEVTKKFSVTVMNIAENVQTTEEFDYVICCSGHFSTPNVPHFEGMETFSGQVMHAHDFRTRLPRRGSLCRAERHGGGLVLQCRGHWLAAVEVRCEDHHGLLPHQTAVFPLPGQLGD